MRKLWLKLDTIDRSVLIAVAIASAMIVAILLRYPSTAQHRELGLLGLGLTVTSALLTAIPGRTSLFPGDNDKRTAARVGALAGLLWVVEISFNNFIDPRISTGRARFYVDNSFWAAIALAILIASLAQAARTRKVSAGVYVGLWSGYISGLIACLMALSLVLFGMRFLLRDPINIAEYAARASGAPPTAMAAYFAYETMAGALGHLFVLGIVMGLLLGSLGGLIGGLLPRLRTPDPSSA